ncbi:FadR/GntR family transcriptional regulator [Gracilibacillus sp. HCP3S3_G5_1]|uniref:FadR/GntR family transcriptional regulator n=1 Tax=unclassified Gracilibacillus TaxID=2625209 RepID=UPI003F8CEFD3
MVIQKPSLVDVVIERIKGYIIEHDLKPNDRFLSEKELMDKLQVSRTVVREALKSLQAVGLLYVKSGGGIYITDNQLDSINIILKHHYETYGVKIKELIEIREILELGALRLIIEKNIDLDFDELRNINHRYLETMNKRENKKYDQLFHENLIKGTANKTYLNFSKIINEYFSHTKIELIENEESHVRSFKQHEAIITALESKELYTAQHVMKEHFKPIFNYINQMEEDSSNETN